MSQTWSVDRPVGKEPTGRAHATARGETMTGTSREPAIRVRELRKTYPGGMEAVKGISFDVSPGEVFGVLGPNGAGKSTTIGMLTTTVAPSSGSATVAGFDVGIAPLHARRASSVIFQESVLDASLSVRRNLDIHAR